MQPTRGKIKTNEQKNDEKRAQHLHKVDQANDAYALVRK